MRIAARLTAAMTPDHGRAEPPSSDAFRLLVENVTEYAIYMLDRDGYVLTWNAGGKRIKGYDADEILGKHFSIFYTAADAKRGKPDYALRIAEGEGRFEDEGWRVRRDGSRFWAHVVITALRSPDGRLIGYAKITSDLTEQKRREDERAALLALERQAREDAQAGLDRIRAIQSVTEAALTFFSLDELLPELLERIRAVLGADTAAVLLLSEDGDVLIARAAKGLEEEVERNVRIPLGAGFAGRVAAERRPIVLDDVERADVLNPILLEKGIRSLVGVPLLVQSRVLGVLHVGTFRRRPFSNDDVELLQIIADRVALSIDHARLVAVATAARSEADAASAQLRALGREQDAAEPCDRADRAADRQAQSPRDAAARDRTRSGRPARAAAPAHERRRPHPQLRRRGAVGHDGTRARPLGPRKSVDVRRSVPARTGDDELAQQRD